MGTILTNDHLVLNGQPLSVTLPDGKQVVAQVLARDMDADLAILRVNPDACTDCPALPLAPFEDLESHLAVGERVVGIGFPLHQEASLTSGIVSSIRRGVVMSDVNLNPGNSGGPLLNLAGTVVGVNTFIDASDTGPGLSGSVLLSEAADVFRAADRVRHSLPLPRLDPIRAIPTEPYPPALLAQLTDSIGGIDQFVGYFGLDAGHFEVYLSTPVVHAVLRNAARRRITRKLEQRAAATDTIDRAGTVPFDVVRDWSKYIEDLNRPAVAVVARPKTGGFLRSGFKGDVHTIELYRNGDLVESSESGTFPLVYVDDLAFEGAALYHPLVFAPDTNTRPPTIVIRVRDVKHLEEPLDSVALAPVLVARIWNDFVPYIEEELGQPVVVANGYVTSSTPGTLRLIFPYDFNLFRAQDVISGAVNRLGFSTIDIQDVGGRLTWVLQEPVRRNEVRVTGQRINREEFHVVVQYDELHTRLRLAAAISRALYLARD
jgi:hypothetical protein